MKRIDKEHYKICLINNHELSSKIDNLIQETFDNYVPTIHRVRSGGAWLWALYYMGSANTWDPRDGTHPNCTRRVDPRTGDRATRRVGLATSASLWGPWARRDSPLLGPGDRAAGDWDYEDVSNATPLHLRNGTVLMLYKGRGGDLQAVGVARCARFDPHLAPLPERARTGCFHRTPSAAQSPTGRRACSRRGS